MGKRADRRKKGVVPFGQIVYHYERYDSRNFSERGQFVYAEARALYWSAIDAGLKPTQPLLSGGKLEFYARRFPSYEAALVHLVNMKLGFVEDTGYEWFTPHKVIGGYISKGRKVVTKTTVVGKLEIKSERFGVRRDQLSDRLFRKKRGPGLSLPEDMEDRWKEEQAYWRRQRKQEHLAMRSYWPIGSVRRTPPVVRHRSVRPVVLPKQGSQWRTISSRITSPRAAALQQFSRSAIARTKQTRYR